jgi:hypothetical protein
MQSMGGNGFEEDRTSPRPGAPPLMQGLPPNFPPYGYRFGQVSPFAVTSSIRAHCAIQSGMSQQQVQGQLQTSPMFSPGPGYTQLPGQLQGLHMSGGPQPANGSTSSLAQSDTRS